MLSRRIVFCLVVLTAICAAAMPVFATPEWLSRPGTIAYAVSEPDGTTVYIDDVTIVKIKGNQNPAYFVVQEQWESNSRIIVSAVPPDTLRLGQDVDIEGTVGTLSNGLRIILNPRVIGYFDESGELLKKCPLMKSLAGITDWQWKAEITLPTEAEPAGDPVAGEPNVQLPPAPAFYDSIASLLGNSDETSAKLERKKIVGKGIDPIYGDYLILGDDFSTTTIKAYGSNLVTVGVASEADETERVNSVSGQVHTIDGTTALVLDEGLVFDTENPSGSIQTVSSGTTNFAKSLANGVTVTISDVIVTDYDPISKVGYVEDANLVGGVRICFGGNPTIARGNTISITGQLRTNAHAERELYVEDSGVTVVSTSVSSVKPWGMINRSLGGADFNGLTPGVNYPLPGAGLYNKGLLVKTCGRVTAVDAANNCFYIEDGSNVRMIDGQGNLIYYKITLKVRWNSDGNVTPPTVGDYLPELIGISSSEAVGSGQYERLLRLRYLPKPALTGTAISKSVALNWTSEEDVLYHVYRALSESGPFSLVADVTAGTYVDAPLVNGTTYYYKVSTSESGIETASNVIALTPTGGVPTVTMDFDPLTFTYTYTVVCPYNNEYSFGSFEVKTLAQNSAPTSTWTAIGPIIADIDRNWQFSSQIWEPEAGFEEAVWDAAGQEIPANMATAAQFILVAPNTAPVSGEVITSGSDTLSVVTHLVMVPSKPHVESTPITEILLDGTLGNEDWYTSPVTVTISASDADDDYLNSFYMLDDVITSWTEYESEFEVTEDGEHQVSAYSVDSNGNSEDPENPIVSSFKIDATAPSVSGEPTTQSNENGWYKTDVTVNYAVVDMTSGLASPQQAEPGESISITHVVSTEGETTDVVEAADVAGNIGTGTVDLKIDKTAPILSLVEAPTGTNHVINFDEAVIRFTADDAVSGTDGTPWVVVTINPSLWTNCHINTFFEWGSSYATRGQWLRSWMQYDDEHPTCRNGWDPFVTWWLHDWIDHNYDENMCNDDWGSFVVDWLWNRTCQQEQEDQDTWSEQSIITYQAEPIGDNTYEVRFPFEIPGSYSVKLFAKDKAGNIAQSATPLTFGASGFTVEWLAPLSTMETYIMEDGSTVPVKFQLRDPANINTYVNNYLYTVKVIDTAENVWKQIQIPDVDLLLGHYQVNIRTKDANGDDWPLGDYTIVIEGPGIWDVMSGPYKSRYGLELVERAVAKGKGRR
jgi:hypothetical protein